ncbi:MAG: hypothetical protein JKY04_00680 [Sneathiella sp.]|nr:hypothetical protein [Sneathiella sp.]
MSKFLNAYFARRPLAFFENYMVRIPKNTDAGSRGSGREFTFQLAPGVRALDMSGPHEKPLQVVDLKPYDDLLGVQRGNPRGKHHCVDCFWMPIIPEQVSTIQLNPKYLFLFMDEMAGCSLAISHGYDNVLHRMPPERRVELINLLIPETSPELKFSYFTPEDHYDCEGHKRTVFYGLQSRFRRKWRFYVQTTLQIQNTPSQYGRFREDAYEYVRFCKNVEFSIPIL